MFQVLAKSFISVEGQIRWVGEKGRVGENICNASPVTGGSPQGLDFICQTLNSLHTYLNCLSENLRRRSDIKELKLGNEQEFQNGWSVWRGGGKIKKLSFKQNSNIVNMHNVQYDKYNVQWIIINLVQHWKILATAHQLIKSL